MATIQNNPGSQSLYKSPYEDFVSIYDRKSVLGSGQNKVPDERNSEQSAHIPSSNYLSRERTVINLDGEADKGFIDIDELLSNMRQKNIVSSGTGKEMNVRSASGSPIAFSQLSQESIQDLNSANINNYMSAESETDNRNLEFDPATISNSDPLYSTVVETADSDTFGSGIALTSDAKSRSTKRSDSDSSAVPSENSTSDHNTFVSELLASQHSSASCSQPGSTVVSLYQSDPTNDPPMKRYRQPDVSKNDHRKRSCALTPTSPASPRTSVSAAYRNDGFECTLSGTRPKALANGQENLSLDQDLGDEGGTDHSSDEDYCNVRDATPSRFREPSHSPKRIKRVGGRKYNNTENSSTHSLNASNQAIIASSSSSAQQSEEITIHGRLTLQTIGSKVMYCLTFAQEPLPELNGVSRRQGTSGIVSGSSSMVESDHLPVQERAMSRAMRKSRFTPQDDDLLRRLKQEEGLSWDEISDHFPTRSKGTLQVHYSTKLRDHSDTSNKRKRQ